MTVGDHLDSVPRWVVGALVKIGSFGWHAGYRKVAAMSNEHGREHLAHVNVEIEPFTSWRPTGPRERTRWGSPLGIGSVDAGVSAGRPGTQFRLRRPGWARGLARQPW